MIVLKIDTSTYLGFKKICNVNKYVQVAGRIQNTDYLNRTVRK
jgi:hypothetical protein